MKKVIKAKKGSVEKRIIQRLQEFTQALENGDDLSRKFTCRKVKSEPNAGPGSFGCHELLDRTAMLGDSVEEYILDHPSCVQNPEWYALADQAVTALRELYQRIGAEHLGNET